MHKNSLSMPSSFFSPIEYGSAVGDEITVTELCKCEGEARVNNRKAKLIFFYEWEIAVKWKGHANGKDTEVFHHHHAHGKPIFRIKLICYFHLR